MTIGKTDYVGILTSQYSSVEFKEYSFYPEEHRVLYHRSTVHVKVLNHEPVDGDSKKYFISVQHSRNHAAKDVLEKLESRQEAQTSSTQSVLFY